MRFDAVSGRFFADRWDDDDEFPVPFFPDDEEDILDLVFENIDGPFEKEKPADEEPAINDEAVDHLFAEFRDSLEELFWGMTSPE